MTDSYSKKELAHESSLHYCVTMKLVYNQVFFPFSFVFFFPYATTCLPACLPAVVFCFRFSVLFRYLPISISCNTTLHIYQLLRTCLSVAQTGYPLLGLIRNTLLRQLPFPQHLHTTSPCPHHQARLHPVHQYY